MTTQVPAPNVPYTVKESTGRKETSVETVKVEAILARRYPGVVFAILRMEPVTPCGCQAS